MKDTHDGKQWGTPEFILNENENENGLQFYYDENGNELCPDCGSIIRAKGIYEGGGVVCTNNECGYWFCF